MINAVQLNGIGNNSYYNSNDLPLAYLHNLNKINIFIGENNSGKSRLMRELIKSDLPKILSKDNISLEDSKRYRDKLCNYIEQMERAGFDCFKKEYFEKLDDVEYFCDLQETIDVSINTLNLSPNAKNYISIMQTILNNMLKELEKVNDMLSQISIKKTSPVYIPILRGIENFNVYFDISKNKTIMDSISLNQDQREALEDYKRNASHIYKNKIQKAYQIDNKLIFTAEDLYEDVTNKLLGPAEGRNFIKGFQEFVSNNFYPGKAFTLIPQKDKGYLNVRIGEQEKPLHELGDGIKQLITILYVIFENKDQSKTFFIEEPELNLHPGFQRKLMEILQLDLFKNHQFFITTHSNHLLDSCFDFDNISLFKFTNVAGANNKFKVEYTLPNDISLLQCLGVNNSSVFMANCTIWVEGISDKIYIKKYLEKYFEKNKVNSFKEDINYAFIEYGGNNITHWDFEPTDSIETINARGITNRSFIICDNDNDSESKKQRKRKLKECFKENYYELTVREIENTISKQVLEKTLFEDKEIKCKKEYEQKDYTKKDVYMGKFIDEHYSSKRKYASQSGTIINKVDFSKKVAKNILTYDDLTSQAKNLCEKIVKFIKDSNL